MVELEKTLESKALAIMEVIIETVNNGTNVTFSDSHADEVVDLAIGPNSVKAASEDRTKDLIDVLYRIMVEDGSKT